MSCGDKGDVNVCFSRVGGFNEHLVSHSHSYSEAPTSLLTFADMVLALDNRNVDDEMKDYSKRENLQDDHNYASNKSHKMTTRSQSQAMRINKADSSEVYGYLDSNSKSPQYLSNSDPVSDCASDSPQLSPTLHEKCHTYASEESLKCSSWCDGNERHQEIVSKVKRSSASKVKRSSSVENINSESVTTGSISEWPPTARIHSPRKSCSFEEVNKNPTVSRKSDDKKGGSSGQLCRLVNDTLEFPCWPRKADHTYATATWDGTAASHGIFEQEMNQIDSKNEILKMDVTEAYFLPFKRRSLNLQPDEVLKSNYPYQQKDDHTYVKQNYTNTSVNPFPGYMCSTFPRQKSRDDHTYFSSPFNKQASSSSGKDWNSVHTIANLPHLQTQSKERNFLSANVPEIISTKKDHNYFTSAR